MVVRVVEREVHTVPFGDGWANRLPGDAEWLSKHPSHAEAVLVGGMIARREDAEHVIHGHEGVIRERRRYGAGPRTIRS